MAALLAAVAPDLPTGIKVTGSNGKGSTCAIAASVLRAHGLRTGLFTSPHLYDPRERIQLDGEPIPAADLERWRAQIMREAVVAEAGSFELWTGMAAGWLSEQGADAVVWEAGIGGRLDATRPIPAPVSILVSVSLEHTALLGATREEIARDKAQIADPGSVLVVGPGVPGFEETARSVDTSGLSLAGAHQRVNARCAVTACQELLGARFDPRAAAVGMASVRWPLRLEQVASDPPVYVDVAHNESGLERIAEAALELDAPIVLVIGVSEDRPWDRMVPIVARVAGRVIATSARHRGAPAEVIAVASPTPALAIPDVAEAVRAAQSWAAQRSGSVLITGGLFLAAEAATALRGGDRGALRW